LKSSLLALAILLSSAGSWAQNQTEEIAATLPTLRQGFGLSLAHPLDPVQPGIYLSYLHQTRELTFARYQVGYLLFLNYADQDGIQDLTGFRLRTNLRQYRKALIDRGRATFWEAGVDYRYLDLTIAGDFSRDRFQYQERINYDMWQHSLSFSILTGASVAFSQRLRLDVGLGAGIRLNYRQFSAVPPDAFFRTNGNIWLWNYQSREGFHATLSVPVIFDLCYYW
jgi:hypothetical protein